MKILGTGLTGLVGSRIVELLEDNYEFDFSTVDITDKNAISEKIKNSDASIVLHLAAKADVEGCEKDKILGQAGEAWKINVGGTSNIVDACLVNNKKLIYISTDFVFDGTKTDGYTEEDIPNPLNWYAQTKYEGEKLVQNSNLSWMIVRIAYPYRPSFIRNDFARAILDRLKNGEKIIGVTDHIFTPTFIDDIAFALDKLIKTNSTGIFHVVGSQSLSPYDAAIIIAEIFNCDKSLISKTTREIFFKDRAPRPFCLKVKNDKISKLGVKMKTLEEGLREVKTQL
jgi:dTDP-4-dehydrorhamnose reductase